MASMKSRYRPSHDAMLHMLAEPLNDNLMEIEDIIVVYLPSILYLSFWISLRNRSGQIVTQTIVLFVFLISLLTFGILTSENYTEITPIGYGLMVSSPLLLLGPILITIGSKLKKKNKERLTGIISTLIIPPIGIIISFFILLLSGQITGL